MSHLCRRLALLATMAVGEISYSAMNCIVVTTDRDRWSDEHGNESLCSVLCWHILE
jgi:hypothetical protein